MRYLLLLLFFLQLPKSGFKYWEDYSKDEREEILNNSSIPCIIKCFYWCDNTQHVTDDDRTKRLLNLLTDCPNNDSLCALYFYVFNKTFSDTDGALSEMVAPYCINVLLEHPVFVFSYLQTRPKLLKWYADQIGFELGMQNEYEKCYEQFKHSFVSKVGSSKSEAFLHMIKERVYSVQ